MPRRRSRSLSGGRFQIGTVENLAVAQLALHVAHDTLPQCDHPGQVLLERLVHDAKDLPPALMVMTARSTRVIPLDAGDLGLFGNDNRVVLEANPVRVALEIKLHGPFLFPGGDGPRAPVGEPEVPGR